MTLYLPNINFFSHEYIIFLKCHWQKEADEITRPFLNALGEDYSVCCQGNLRAFLSFKVYLLNLLSLKIKRFTDLRLFVLFLRKDLKTSYRPLKFQEVHHPPLIF